MAAVFQFPFGNVHAIVVCCTRTLLDFYVCHIIYLTEMQPIRDLRSLFGLSEMRTLILDNNQITSHTVFPPLPKLKILWVNKNSISNLSVFMESVATNFPELEQLCMMNNPAAPSYFNGGSRQEYLDYR